MWLVGIVFASLLPFFWQSQSSKPGSAASPWYQLLGNGDLYLISILVLIAGITEIALLLHVIQQDLTVALLILGGFLFVVLDAARYAGASALRDGNSAAVLHSVASALRDGNTAAALQSVASALPGGTAAELHSVAYWSLAAFVVSALHSSFCVGLSAGAPR